MKVTAFDPDASSFTVKLPIAAGSSDAYMLTYMADIIQRETGATKAASALRAVPPSWVAAKKTARP